MARTVAAVLLATTAITAAPAPRDDAARAAVYRLLLASGYTVNRSAPACFCLAVRGLDGEGRPRITDPPPTAFPERRGDGPRIRAYSECREACLILYTSDVVWDESSTATVVGGLFGIHSRHLLTARPRPDATRFMVEEQPGRGWVVIGKSPVPEPMINLLK